MRNNPTVKPRIFAAALSVLLFATVVGAANGLHVAYITFPELGALASDVLVRPGGKWAKVPWKLIATPSCSAVTGILVSRFFPYSVGSVLLAMTIGIAIVFALKSAVAPAISAGVLPVVLGVTSWLYPVCILSTLTVLTSILLIWRRTPAGKALTPNLLPDDRAVEILESKPNGRYWMIALFSFVAVIGLAAQISTWRFILFPPLIVMAYEMFGHMDTCPWAKAPYSFPVVCSLAALVGVEAVLWLGNNPFAAAIVMAFTFVLLSVVRLRMPPAHAVGLIPFVLQSPTITYAAGVCVGTVSLTCWFLVFRWVIELRRPSDGAY